MRTTPLNLVPVKVLPFLKLVEGKYREWIIGIKVNGYPKAPNTYLFVATQNMYGPRREDGMHNRRIGKQIQQ